LYNDVPDPKVPRDVPVWPRQVLPEILRPRRPEIVEVPRPTGVISARLICGEICFDVRQDGKLKHMGHDQLMKEHPKELLEFLERCQNKH
jgi:hypothetical protein